MEEKKKIEEIKEEIVTEVKGEVKTEIKEKILEEVKEEKKKVTFGFFYLKKIYKLYLHYYKYRRHFYYQIEQRELQKKAIILISSSLIKEVAKKTFIKRRRSAFRLGNKPSKLAIFYLRERFKWNIYKYKKYRRYEKKKYLALARLNIFKKRLNKFSFFLYRKYLTLFKMSGKLDFSKLLTSFSDFLDYKLKMVFLYYSFLFQNKKLNDNLKSLNCYLIDFLKQYLSKTIINKQVIVAKPKQLKKKLVKGKKQFKKLEWAYIQLISLAKLLFFFNKKGKHWKTLQQKRIKSPFNIKSFFKSLLRRQKIKLNIKKYPYFLKKKFKRQRRGRFWKTRFYRYELKKYFTRLKKVTFHEQYGRFKKLNLFFFLFVYYYRPFLRQEFYVLLKSFLFKKIVSFVFFKAGVYNIIKSYKPFLLNRLKKKHEREDKQRSINKLHGLIEWIKFKTFQITTKTKLFRLLSLVKGRTFSKKGLYRRKKKIKRYLKRNLILFIRGKKIKFLRFKKFTSFEKKKLYFLKFLKFLKARYLIRKFFFNYYIIQKYNKKNRVNFFFGLNNLESYFGQEKTELLNKQKFSHKKLLIYRKKKVILRPMFKKKSFFFRYKLVFRKVFPFSGLSFFLTHKLYLKSLLQTFCFNLFFNAENLKYKWQNIFFNITKKMDILYLRNFFFFANSLAFCSNIFSVVLRQVFNGSQKFWEPYKNNINSVKKFLIENKKSCFFKRFKTIVTLKKNNFFLTFVEIYNDKPARVIFKVSPGMLKFSGSFKMDKYAIEHTVKYYRKQINKLFLLFIKKLLQKKKVIIKSKRNYVFKIKKLSRKFLRMSYLFKSLKKRIIIPVLKFLRRRLFCRVTFKQYLVLYARNGCRHKRKRRV